MTDSVVGLPFEQLPAKSLALFAHRISIEIDPIIEEVNLARIDPLAS